MIGSDKPSEVTSRNAGATGAVRPSAHYRDAMSATPTLRLSEDRRGDDWRSGDAITPHGIVSIYDQGRLSGKDQLTRFDVVAGGRLHIATWERTFSDRFLVTLAQRFAKAVNP